MQVLLCVIAVVALAACQSTSLRSAWFDTGFSGPPMRKIVVVGELGSVAQANGLLLVRLLGVDTRTQVNTGP